MGDTGRGGFPLGTFWVTVDVTNVEDRTVIRFANQMPDSGEVLSGEEEASLTAGGSWQFDFIDGWGNRGNGALSPAAVLELTIIEDAPDELSRNIGRNYGTYRLNQQDCAGLPTPLS